MAYIPEIPKFGFGTAFSIGTADGQTSEDEFSQLLRHAIKLGVRHLDCAPLYGTQPLVGAVLKEMSYSIPRSEFFIASKLSVNMMREDNIERSLKRTLAELQLTYLDLFLIHAPFSTQHVADNEVYPLDQEGNLLLDDTENRLELAWKKLVDLKQKGYVKYIGISNVNMEQLDRLLAIHQVDVVQNEYHIYNQRRELFDYCEEVDVHFEAYSAFGCPPKAKQDNKPSFMTDPVVSAIAKENNISKSHVIIQWLHQQPLSYVIRCDNISQLEENLRATTFKPLSINDLIELDSLNRDIRLYYFDNHKGIARHKEYPFTKRPSNYAGGHLHEPQERNANL